MSELVFDWTYIGKIDKLTPCQMHHCDTRDFYINGWNGCDDYLETKGVLQSRMKEPMENYMVRADEILGILASMESEAGGMGSWRHLTVDEMWLKYVRFLRHGEIEMFGNMIPSYIVYTGNGRNAYPVLRRKIVELPEQDKGILNFINDKDFKNMKGE